MAESGWTFSEREFYLAEFRGRTLGIALAKAPEDSLDRLAEVVAELAKNGTRCVIVSPVRDLLEAVSPGVVSPGTDRDWVGGLWRILRGSTVAGLWLPEASPVDEGPADFASRCRSALLELRLAKVVWIDDRGSLQDASGARISLLDLSESERVSVAGSPDSGPNRAFLGEIRHLLEGGVASVNICSLAGLSDELFTYAGSGTLVTRERYLEVRPLGIDDFDAATDLIARGVDEGYLAPRSEAEVEAALGNAFGVFVEGRYLAGIAALVAYEADKAAEIVSLYTVTRFAGEGVGGHLVGSAVEQARAAGFAQIFACTTSSRVEKFFMRQGFSLAPGEEIPESKWQGYPPERRERVRCLVCALD